MDAIQEPKYFRIEKCRECGCEFKSTLSVHSRQFCPECMEKHLQEHDALVDEYVVLKRKIMHETALRKLERSRDTYDFRRFDEAISAVEEMERIRPDAFKSSEEIVAAICLYEAGYFFQVNHKVLKYTVDFFLPEEKIIIEVDGGCHDIGSHRARDGRRDVELRSELGSEWEIVRIPASRVSEHPTMVGDVAEELACKQRELRAKNHGALPYNYSKSVKAYYEKVLKE